MTGSAGLAALLVLADGRFPAGGHAHSGGLEAVVASGAVHDIVTLRTFLDGRLSDVGASEAQLAVAAAGRATPWVALEAEASARVPSPALRAISRTLGRSLVRAARPAWPGPILDELAATLPGGAMYPVAWGAVAAAAGIAPEAAAAGILLAAINAPAAAAVKLLGLDPFAVTATLAALGPRIDTLAAEAVATVATRPLRLLTAPGAPLPDLAAEDHATWSMRLFAS